MTSLERIRCAGGLGKPDAIPVAPFMGNHGARVAGVPVDEYCRSGRLMAAAQSWAWEVYHQDVVVAQSDNYYIAEGFGTVVEHHADSTPSLKRPAIQDLSDIGRLVVPDPRKDGRMPVYLEAIGRLADRFAGQVAVRAPGTGPFSLASHLMGTERFLMELAMADLEPGGQAERSLRTLMSLTTEALIAFAKACLEAGANIVQNGDSLASIDMISPDMYRRWAWPYEQRFFAEVNPLAARRGAATLLHICGNMTPVLDRMADTGANILELDAKVDLRLAKKQVGHRVCLMGNLNPVSILWRGTTADVEHAAREAILAAGEAGFILGSGCEVPMAAPQENIATMIHIARTWRA